MCLKKLDLTELLFENKILGFSFGTAHDSVSMVKKGRGNLELGIYSH